MKYFCQPLLLFIFELFCWREFGTYCMHGIWWMVVAWVAPYMMMICRRWLLFLLHKDAVNINECLRGRRMHRVGNDVCARTIESRRWVTIMFAPLPFFGLLCECVWERRSTNWSYHPLKPPSPIHRSPSCYFYPTPPALPANWFAFFYSWTSSLPFHLYLLLFGCWAFAHVLSQCFAYSAI